jgi:hypothetical protein
MDIFLRYYLKYYKHSLIFLVLTLFITFITESIFIHKEPEFSNTKSILLIDDNYIEKKNYTNLIINNITNNKGEDTFHNDSHMDYILENANTYLMSKNSTCEIEIIEIAEDNIIDIEDIKKLYSYDLKNYDIINISWGSNKNYIEYEIFQKLLEEKKDLIINASNSNIKNEKFYPANLEKITSVSNLTNFMNKSKSDRVIKNVESSSLATFYKSLNDSGCIK